MWALKMLVNKYSRACVCTRVGVCVCVCICVCKYIGWFGFFCSKAGYISRIDSLRGSLTPSARSYTLQLHALTNNTFVNLTNRSISRLYTSTSGYMLFKYLNNIYPSVLVYIKPIHTHTHAYIYIYILYYYAPSLRCC